MFKRTKVAAGVLVAVSGYLMLGGTDAAAQAQSVSVTGSKIKRTDAEGSLPVTTYNRADLDSSGAASVAEFVRDLTFGTDGQFRPQSGSSAQSFAGVNLRGLGSARTLVLVDGRRVAKSPAVGDAADMNSIPLAAVERIEILTDGASAIYGSDAIGGVVNIILRRDFNGAAISYEKTNTSTKGGDRESSSAIYGLSSDKGRLIAGVSKTSRDIVFVRDYPADWRAYTPGASSFSNNYFSAVQVEPGVFVAGSLRGIAGNCNFPDKGFYISGGRCRYDFNLVAADEAAVSNQSVFARGEVRINNDWSTYFSASNTRTTSFGRYAPVPDFVLIQPTSPNARAGATVPEYLGHRFAAAGNRDTSTDGALNDVVMGFQGTVASKFDVDVGVRRSNYKIVETGRGFVVKEVATRLINEGTYNVRDPFNNTPAVLTSLTTTTGRDSVFGQTEAYANAQFPMFKMAGGDARMFVAAERRKETYADIYDALSESGQVLGSAGNSAGGGRQVTAYAAEALLPVTKQLEASLAGRYERYSDYGNDFSPKVSVRYQPRKDLLFRASLGRGFGAPSLPTLTQKPAFSADSVIDRRTCLADGSVPAAQCSTESFQINGLRISNPELKSERSKQFTLGTVWDVNQNVSLKVDYWNIEIDNVISFISAQTIVNRNNGTDPLAIPAGLSITRDPVTGAIQRIVSGNANEGNLRYSGFDTSALLQYRALGGSFRHDLQVSIRTRAESNGEDFNGVFGQPKSRTLLRNTYAAGNWATTLALKQIGANGQDDLKVGAYTTFDVQVAYQLPLKGSRLSIGALNLTKKYPELVTNDAKPFNYNLYDIYGRQVYVRADMRF